jgi:hypothetical protein
MLRPEPPRAFADAGGASEPMRRAVHELGVDLAIVEV